MRRAIGKLTHTFSLWPCIFCEICKGDSPGVSLSFMALYLRVGFRHGGLRLAADEFKGSMGLPVRRPGKVDGCLGKWALVIIIFELFITFRSEENFTIKIN